MWAANRAGLCDPDAFAPFAIASWQQTRMMQSLRRCAHDSAARQRCAAPPRARLRALAMAKPSPVLVETEEVLLEWATQQRASDLPCRAGLSPQTGVRGLLATRDISPGETILAVPLERVYQSQVRE